MSAKFELKFDEPATGAKSKSVGFLPSQPAAAELWNGSHAAQINSSKSEPMYANAATTSSRSRAKFPNGYAAAAWPSATATVPTTDSNTDDNGGTEPTAWMCQQPDPSYVPKPCVFHFLHFNHFSNKNLQESHELIKMIVNEMIKGFPPPQ